jgi:hypothetical protein
MGCILEKMDDNNVVVPKDKSNISIDKSNISNDKSNISIYKSKENSMKVDCETNLRIRIPKEKKYKKNNYI